MIKIRYIIIIVFIALFCFILIKTDFQFSNGGASSNSTKIQPNIIEPNEVDQQKKDDSILSTKIGIGNISIITTSMGLEALATESIGVSNKENGNISGTYAICHAAKINETIVNNIKSGDSILKPETIIENSTLEIKIGNASIFTTFEGVEEHIFVDNVTINTTRDITSICYSVKISA